MKKTLLLLTLLTTITIAKNNVEIIHGHTLPPEPDPIVNNATLLGVDSNDNGVRDDVERAIYKKYDKKLHALFLMDGAKQFQKVLTQPIENAKDIEKDISRTTDCKVYLRRIDSRIKSDEFNYTGYLADVTFNNIERTARYLDFNKALSGGNYASYPQDWAKHSCSQEVQNQLEEMGL